jgi:hypothetical protein
MSPGLFFVPTLSQACPKLFWDMEVVVSVVVVVFCLTMFTLFRAQISVLFNYCE